MNTKIIVIIFSLLFITTLVPFTPAQPITTTDEYPLPPPLSIDTILEETICQRMSTRSYTTQTVTDQELSTILWAAYGTTDTGNRTIYNPTNTYSTIIYVIRNDATYTYNPLNHSLVLFKNGNYLHLGQYTTPIKFGLVWDQTLEPDEKRAMADIGMIGQNIYFDAIALNLATVTTGMYVDDLLQLGIPPSQKPEIIMPLGHPTAAYDFSYDPLPPANLPSIINHTDTLAQAINTRIISTHWDNTPLTPLEQSQLMWSAYGYSYLYDHVNNKRHRTVPSAIGYYPFKLYIANHTGIYQYHYNTHSITTILTGDQRAQIQSSLATTPIDLTTAPFILIPVLDTNIGTTTYQRFWYYENGAIINNILLEATAQDLTSNIIYDITNEADLRTALGIPSQTHLKPLSVIPVGNPQQATNHPPNPPTITGPKKGNPGIAYTYTFQAIDIDNDTIYFYIKWGDTQEEPWNGPHSSGTDVTLSHTYAEEGTYTIEAKAKDPSGAESTWGSLTIRMPYSYNVLWNWLQHCFPLMYSILRLIF